MPTHVPDLPGLSDDDRAAHGRAMTDYLRSGCVLDYLALVAFHRDRIRTLRCVGVHPVRFNGEDGRPRFAPRPPPVRGQGTAFFWWWVTVGLACLLGTYLVAVN